jgi:hypothetical protein
MRFTRRECKLLPGMAASRKCRLAAQSTVDEEIRQMAHRVVRRQTALGHQFFNVAIREGIRKYLPTRTK